MLITLSVTVFHNGESSPDQLVTADVTRPNDDGPLRPWADTELAPKILASTTAVAGDKVWADGVSCDELPYLANMRFRLEV
jgi:hypothetical protein